VSTGNFHPAKALARTVRAWGTLNLSSNSRRGYGAISAHVAADLAMLRFPVKVWSRSKKPVPAGPLDLRRGAVRIEIFGDRVHWVHPTSWKISNGASADDGAGGDESRRPSLKNKRVCFVGSRLSGFKVRTPRIPQFSSRSDLVA
jgi:hypothetical protein